MLTKRIIPCLDVKNGRTVKGVNFLNLKDAGDPVELADRYAKEGADELVFLDISATLEERKTLVELVERVAEKINIPFAVGGGISSMEDVGRLLEAGADKVSINSSAIRNPDLINAISEKFGSQCLILAIDAKKKQEKWEVYSSGGTIPTGLELIDWARKGVKRGAGEILFTAMNKDGTRDGFANQILVTLSASVNVPVIASGGAGCIQHFVDAFNEGRADAALAASVFHFREIAIPKLKSVLQKQNISVRI